MKSNVKKALDVFNQEMREQGRTVITFDEYLEMAINDPWHTFRNHFIFFHDVIKKNLISVEEADKNDPENIGFLEYNSDLLFKTGFDRPFFSNTILDNELIKIADTVYNSSQQNRIYIIYGPPGSGKSTCVNNLMQKFENEANSKEGQRFEVLWRINKNLLIKRDGGNINVADKTVCDENILEVPCPSHDAPILVIPKPYRMRYLQALFGGDKAIMRELGLKRYEWIFNDKSCTICESLFWNLFDIVGLEKTMKMIYAQAYEFNRRLGKGISVFNPDDMDRDNPVISDDIMQKELDALFKGGDRVFYMYSKYAGTNYGFYVLMDVKKRNKGRLEALHNILSEGINKIDRLEENINSIFIAVMNPEDIKNGNESIISKPSFKDRQELIKLPHILDPEKEVETYRVVHEHNLDESFLPKVMLNFARTVVSTRMEVDARSVKEWIGDPAKYSKYCDKELRLLRMSLYKAIIPRWISEEDRRKFSAQIRRKVISEATIAEGNAGLSGRDSLRLFHKFYSSYAQSEQLINMRMLVGFFKVKHEELKGVLVSWEFLESLTRLYDYSIMQEIKESFFSCNEDQISKDVQNYLFAIFENKNVEKVCPYTNDKLVINETFLNELENRMVGKDMSRQEHIEYRKRVEKKLLITFARESFGRDCMSIKNTNLYKELRDSYFHVLKENSLEPAWNNDGFKQAVKDYGKKEFTACDDSVRKDVTRMISNLQKKFDYSERGARDVVLYALEKNLLKC